MALLKRLILPEGYNLSKHPGESFPPSLSCIKQGLAISRLNKSTEKQVVALRGFFKACVRKYIMSAEFDVPKKELRSCIDSLHGIHIGRACRMLQRFIFSEYCCRNW